MLRTFIFALLFALAPISIAAQISNQNSVYESLKSFDLSGGRAEVSNLTLERDRGVMTFNGTFYFMAPVEGRVTGAVFIGNGVFRAEIPPSDFEKAHVKRMLDADVVESDFKTAVLRFSDDTFDRIGTAVQPGVADESARKLAIQFNSLMMEETAANTAARIALSILNKESPGYFSAMFNGGKRGRFYYILDPQSRIPSYYFDINGGEKGMIFTNRNAAFGNDIWMAFYGLDDYRTKFVQYSDTFDLVDIESYTMTIDLRTPKSKLGIRASIRAKILKDNVRAIPFRLGEYLDEVENQRLNKQLRVRSASISGTPVPFVQEDWEGGFTLFGNSVFKTGQTIDIDLDIDGDFMTQGERDTEIYYPLLDVAWMPRHGFLDRATFDMTFLHKSNLKIAANGLRTNEAPSPENKDVTVTRYQMKTPVSFTTFAVGPFQRITGTIKWDNGDPPTPLEYNSVTFIPIKESFIMAELDNCVRYFQSIFGKYPYESYGAVYHPYGYGLGFPSMILIPPSDDANRYTFSFLAHETAHQWWGNAVTWRSYRDQWLSEGFAEYSGILYAALRKDYGASRVLIERMRRDLKDRPRTRYGLATGKLYQVGPIILGQRVESKETFGAYGALAYNKGGLVLRMLHYLFSDPETGKGDLFFAMMRDFVDRHRNGVASTDDFRAVVNEHFAKTPIAQRFRISNLNWFFQQWVYESDMPSYTLEYALVDQPDGSVILNGTVLQQNVPEKWAMILPVTIKFSEKEGGTTPVLAVGPSRTFKIKLPKRPKSVELDPEHWIMSEKTETK